MRKRFKEFNEDPTNWGYVAGILALAIVSFFKLNTVNVECDLVAVYPERERISLEVAMPNGEMDEYWVDYDYPIPDDADTVTFSTFAWNEEKYDTYRVEYVY